MKHVLNVWNPDGDVLSELVIPLDRDRAAILYVPTKITENEYEFVMQMLELYKSRITVGDTPEAVPEQTVERAE